MTIFKNSVQLGLALITPLAQIGLVIAKLFGLIGWSWLQVFTPLWISLGLVVIMLVVVAIGGDDWIGDE